MQALLALALSTAAVGIDVGWQPVEDGGLEYIIQIEPELLARLKPGDELSAGIRPVLRDVRRYRIVIGKGELPRIAQSERSVPVPTSSVASPAVAANVPTEVPRVAQAAPAGSPPESSVLRRGPPSKIPPTAEGKPTLTVAPPAPSREAILPTNGKDPLTSESKPVVAPLSSAPEWIPAKPKTPPLTVPTAADQTPPPLVKGNPPSGKIEADPGLDLPQVPRRDPFNVSSEKSPAATPVLPAQKPELKPTDAPIVAPPANAPNAEAPKAAPPYAPLSPAERYRDTDRYGSIRDPIFVTPSSRDAAQGIQAAVVEKPRQALLSPEIPPLAKPAALPSDPLVRPVSGENESKSLTAAKIGTSTTPAATTQKSSPASDSSTSTSTAPPPAAESRPWLALTLVLFALFASIGGNVFLGWIAHDARTRYRRHLSDLRLRTAP